MPPPQGGPDRPARVRWYTHAWNRPIAWRLIHRVVPNIPRPLRPPLHLLTTAVCFAAMPRERAAARRNLGRILGSTAPAGLGPAFRLFYNFSKFMVGYTDLSPFRPERMDGRIEGGEQAAAAIRAALGEGKGLILLTLHLGNWEVGLAYLARLGGPVTVVLRPEEGPAAPFEERARAHPGLRIVAAGESEFGGLDLLLALRRGEIVTLQGDRPLGPASVRVDLFGAPADLPSGPFALAQASGAPILVVAFPIRGHDRYRVEVEGPLRVAGGPDGVAEAAAGFARRLEATVRRHPTQWFNFYDVWDGQRD
jgi:lauroyl/myristoyl acyltransferase